VGTSNARKSVGLNSWCRMTVRKLLIVQCFAAALCLLATIATTVWISTQQLVWEELLPQVAENLSSDIDDGSMFSIEDLDCVEVEQNQGVQKFLTASLNSGTDQEILLALRIVERCEELFSMHSGNIASLLGHSNEHVRSLAADLIEKMKKTSEKANESA